MNCYPQTTNVLSLRKGNNNYLFLTPELGKPPDGLLTGRYYSHRFLDLRPFPAIVPYWYCGIQSHNVCFRLISDRIKEEIHFSHILTRTYNLLQKKAVVNTSTQDTTSFYLLHLRSFWNWLGNWTSRSTIFVSASAKFISSHRFSVLFLLR